MLLFAAFHYVLEELTLVAVIKVSYSKNVGFAKSDL